MASTYPLEVRFRDLDIAGHVHNSVSLSYFEEGRIQYFKEVAGEEWPWRKKGIVLGRNEVDYLKPVYLHDDIQIEVTCDHIGTKSFTLSYVIFSEEDGEQKIIHTKGRSILVCMDYETNESVEIFPEWLKALKVEL